MTTRRDTLRNREALIGAARKVFESEGIDAPLENVAASAGLSRTSLHRHFDSRAELVAAIWAADVEETEADAERFAAFPEGFIELFDRTLLQQVDRRSIHPNAAQIDSPEIETLAARFVAAIQSAVRASRAAGVLRDDVTDELGLHAVGMAIYAVWNMPERAARYDVFLDVRRLLLRGLVDSGWAAFHLDLMNGPSD